LIASEEKFLETYVKGVHCEEAIKNLIKFLRSDNNENPCAKLILSEYNIVDNANSSHCRLCQVRKAK